MNEKGELFLLSNIVLNITDRCNLRCKYCFTNPNPRVITLDKAKKIIEWGLKESNGNTITVNFFGGEPMLEFERIIKPLVMWTESEDKPVKYGLTTNGTLLTKKNIEWLASHYINILLSIDGGPETQNLNRPSISGFDSFMKVCENIPCLLENLPLTIFRSTLEPDNLDKMFENYLWANRLGFVYYSLVPNEFNSWSEENLVKMAENIRRIFWEMYKQITNEERITMPISFDEAIRVLFNPPTPQAHLIGRCGLGTASVGIGCNGEIFGCQEFNTWNTDSIFYLGNVFEQGIEENRRKALIQKFLQERPKDITGCLSHNYQINGNIGKMSEVMKVRYGTTISTVAEILNDAATKNNRKFLDFVLLRIKDMGGGNQ